MKRMRFSKTIYMFCQVLPALAGVTRQGRDKLGLYMMDNLKPRQARPLQDGMAKAVFARFNVAESFSFPFFFKNPFPLLVEDIVARPRQARPLQDGMAKAVVMCSVRSCPPWRV
jgi:hypothetical protein